MYDPLYILPKNIQIHYPDYKCFVLAEEKLLSSAFENLIRNALLHTRADTKIEISINSVDDEFVIAIRDHGPGVDEEHIPYLTQPFYRAEHARERVAQDVKQQRSGGRGYGLGMAIAHRVIRSFGGRMEIRNHSEGGLEISCYLNRHE